MPISTCPGVGGGHGTFDDKCARVQSVRVHCIRVQFLECSVSEYYVSESSVSESGGGGHGPLDDVLTEERVYWKTFFLVSWQESSVSLI